MHETDKIYVVLANTIKFGIPMGVLSALSIIVFSYFISDGGLNKNVIESSISTFLVWVLFGIVLGLIRKK